MNPHGFPPPPHQNISVGGPSGIHIQNGVPIVGGQPMGPPMLGGPMVPAQSPAPMVPTLSADTRALGRLAAKNRTPVAAVLAFVGLSLVFGPSAFWFALWGVSLPWFLALGPALVGLVLVVSAVVVLRRPSGAAASALDPDVERRLLDVAFEHKGRLTVTAAARGTGLTLSEAEAALGVLVKHGHVTVDNDPATGTLVYVFPDIGVALLGDGRR